MRALQFKICIDTLIMRNWDDFKREDQDYLEQNARKNNLTMDYDPKYLEMTISGDKVEDLFFFLHDVAYRYDIELI